MKIFKTIQIQQKELEKLVCDKCKKEYEDVWEIQEFHNISFVAGYSSMLGDGNKIECDLCQKCFKELIGPYLRIIKNIN